jgi:hypothetical protein
VKKVIQAGELFGQKQINLEKDKINKSHSCAMCQTAVCNSDSIILSLN